MKSETPKGKIKLLDPSVELPFSIHPDTFQLSKRFEYEIDSCIGENQPFVSFKSGGVRTLEVVIHFDQDIDKEFRFSKLSQFLEKLEEVNPKTQCISQVEFRLGDFELTGYIENYHLQPTRFNRSYQIQQASLSLTLIESQNREA